MKDIDSFLRWQEGITRASRVSETARLSVFEQISGTESRTLGLRVNGRKRHLKDSES